MKMNEHQKRLWQSMINSIQSLLDGSNDNFVDIVGQLEGALDAAEFKDNELVAQWYECWTPLEVRRSIEGNGVSLKKATEELKLMLAFLLDNQNK